MLESVYWELLDVCVVEDCTQTTLGGLISPQQASPVLSIAPFVCCASHIPVGQCASDVLSARCRSTTKDRDICEYACRIGQYCGTVSPLMQHDVGPGGNKV